MWEVLYTDEFGTWFESLTEDQQDAVIARVDLLEAEGPALGRPTFDPRRQAVLLIGGDKAGKWQAWYEKAIPLADDLFDEYLRESGQA